MNHKDTPRKSSIKRAMLVLVGLVAVLLILFLLRYPIVRAYANTFYKNSVGEQFDKHFQAITPKLKELGFTFAGSPPAGYQTNSHTCAGVRRGLMWCYKSQNSNEQSVTAPFVDNWKQRAAAFETYMVANGWHAIGTKQSLEELYNDPDPEDVFARTVQFIHNDSQCTVSIEYSPSLLKTSAHEICSRNLRFPDLPTRTAE